MAAMAKANKFFPKLFIPPDGLIRPMPPEKRAAYVEKSKAIGSFSRHVYDMDICTLYRQMDDLKGKYKEFAGAPYANYVEHMRENVKQELGLLNMDPEFYIDHSYYVIKPNHSSYIAYLGLFFCMSDPLLVVPKLERQLKQFLIHDPLGRSAESFLGELEFVVCNAIRTARFPEDYHVKHDKIINWVYNERESDQYKKEINAKLDALISGINKMLPKQKIPKDIIRVSPGGKKDENQEVRLAPKMIDHFLKDLAGYFNKSSNEALTKILSGNAEPGLMVNFDGHANQLIDVFRIYKEACLIEADKRAVANWMVDHFMYKNEKLAGFVPFGLAAVERVIYSSNPVIKDKRITLHGLLKPQGSYYSNKKKSSSDTRSDD